MNAIQLGPLLETNQCDDPRQQFANMHWRYQGGEACSTVAWYVSYLIVDSQKHLLLLQSEYWGSRSKATFLADVSSASEASHAGNELCIAQVYWFWFLP